MKKITIQKSLLNILKLGVFFVVFLNSGIMKAQVFQNTVLYISDGSYLYMNSTLSPANYQFGTASGVSSSSTRTSPSTNAYGRLAFGEGVVPFTTAPYNVRDDHFFDGYVTTYSTNDFTFPVGQSLVYAPITVNATNAQGVDAAYYHSSPAVAPVSNATFDVTLRKLYTTGYWNVQETTGSTADAKITLIWDETLKALIGPDLASLTVAGFNGTNWVKIPSNPAIGTVGAGTITTTNDVDLDVFKYFTFAQLNACAPVLPDALGIITWNGTDWRDVSNNIVSPTEKSTAALAAPFSGNLKVNTLAMGAFDVTLGDNQVLEVINGFTKTTGKVIMTSSASVIQRDNDDTTAPLIELTKKTRFLPRYSYTYFGSPVQENAFSQLADAYYLTPTDKGRLYNHYKWIPGDAAVTPLIDGNPYTTSWVYLTPANMPVANTPTAGTGWISSIVSKSPFYGTTSGVISLKFTGNANNGDVVVDVFRPSLDFTASAPDAYSNLLANPYPSAINANIFLDDNTNIDGVIYIWKAQTAPCAIGEPCVNNDPALEPINNATGFYDASDYITYTKVGSTVPNVSDDVFNGKIASGQGFMVNTTVATPQPSTVTFTNCMRLAGSADNTDFSKTSGGKDVTNTEVIDKFKLNLTSSMGYFNQALIAYVQDLTTGYDRGYDAPREPNSKFQLFTILGVNEKKLAIDARPSFSNTDVVPLGFKTLIKNDIPSLDLSTLTYQINIVEKEGIFQNDNVDVFIHDKLNNTYHNFDAGVFTFTSTEAELLDRFEVVYQPSSTLDNTDFDGNNVLVTLNDNTLKVSSKEFIENAYIFDMTGRLISKIEINSFDYTGNFNHAQAVYVVRVELSNGQFATIKLINK